jgi:hypothetical protein
VSSFNPFRSLLGFAFMAAVAAVAWFTVGQDTLDRINETNPGGPPNKRIVAARRFTPVVAKLRRAAGSEARLVSLTVRPASVEMIAATGGRARGYRWLHGRDGIERFEVGGAGAAGEVSSKPFSMSQLDTRAPERITRAIAKAEGGDFQLSIGDLERAQTGTIVWILRGRIGERGIAYYARANGRRIKPYNPSDPELSSATRLRLCIVAAKGDPAKLRRCSKRHSP